MPSATEESQDDLITEVLSDDDDFMYLREIERKFLPSPTKIKKESEDKLRGELDPLAALGATNASGENLAGTLAAPASPGGVPGLASKPSSPGTGKLPRIKPSSTKGMKGVNGMKTTRPTSKAKASSQSSASTSASAPGSARQGRSSPSPNSRKGR